MTASSVVKAENFKNLMEVFCSGGFFLKFWQVFFSDGGLWETNMSPNVTMRFPLQFCQPSMMQLFIADFCLDVVLSSFQRKKFVRKKLPQSCCFKFDQ